MARERELSIDGMANVRDLGGLTTRDGKTVKAGVVVHDQFGTATLTRARGGSRIDIAGCRRPSGLAGREAEHGAARNEGETARGAAGEELGAIDVSHSDDS